jgi:hypothetical protein
VGAQVLDLGGLDEADLGLDLGQRDPEAAPEAALGAGSPSRGGAQRGAAPVSFKAAGAVSGVVSRAISAWASEAERGAGLWLSAPFLGGQLSDAKTPAAQFAAQLVAGEGVANGLWNGDGFLDGAGHVGDVVKIT